MLHYVIVWLFGVGQMENIGVLELFHWKWAMGVNSSVSCVPEKTKQWSSVELNGFITMYDVIFWSTFSIINELVIAPLIMTVYI